MGSKALILSLRFNPLAIFAPLQILLLLTHTARRASRARGSPASWEALIDVIAAASPCTPSRQHGRTAMNGGDDTLERFGAKRHAELTLFFQHVIMCSSSERE